MSITETQISNGQRVTLNAIETDLNAGKWDALYFAKEEQILALINANRICEDFLSRHQDYQEEMRVMMGQL